MKLIVVKWDLKSKQYVEQKVSIKHATYMAPDTEWSGLAVTYPELFNKVAVTAVRIGKTSVRIYVTDFNKRTPKAY